MPRIRVLRKGYQRQGYQRQGYQRQGYQRQGYQRQGYQRQGYQLHQHRRQRRAHPAAAVERLPGAVLSSACAWSGHII